MQHWLPLTPDENYHAALVEPARRAGVAAVHFSHRICHDADDLLEDPERAARTRELLARWAAAGIPVWCWTHEVKRPAERWVRDGRLLADEEGLYADIAHKYERFLDAVLPGLAGLVLTLAETDYAVYRDRAVTSARPRPERVRRLVACLHEVCRRRGVGLAVRDFVYRADEVTAMGEALRGLTEDVVVMSKCVPHDWQPFYPANPLLGAVGDREQWVEHDLGYEYEGQHAYPYADLRGLLARLRRERALGLGTRCLRLDRFGGAAGQSAPLLPWGRLALAAVTAAERGEPDAERLWGEWEAGQFADARRCLEAATAAVQHGLYCQHLWFNCHSDLPTYHYASRSLTGGMADRLAAWTGDPADAARERAAAAATPAWVEAASAEGRASEALARAARDLFRAAPDPGPDAAAWRAGLDRLVPWMELWGAAKRAYAAVHRCRRDAAADRAAAVAAVDALAELTRSAAAPLADGPIGGAPPGAVRRAPWIWPPDAPPPDDSAPWAQCVQSLRLALTEDT